MVPFIGTLSKGWLAKHNHIVFDRDYYFNPIKRYETDKVCSEVAAKELADLDIFYSESNLGQPDYISADQVLVGGIQPNMILGMLIGAAFHPNDSMDADISPTPLKGKDLDDLPTPASLLQHEIIQLFDEQIQQLQGSALTPIPPFFWDASGRATIHGALTTAQKFLGEDIFIDLMLQPDKIVRVMNWITDCYIVLVRHFSELAGLPITSVHVGECSASLVNDSLFHQFVAPQAQRISESLGPLRFHTCGPSTHLLPSIHTIAGLASLDLGGGTSIAKVRELYGQDLPVDIAPLAPDFSAPTAKPILAWAQQVVADNGGGNLKIVYHLEPNYNLDVVRALHDYLKNA